MKTFTLILGTFLTAAIVGHAQTIENCDTNRSSPPPGRYSWAAGAEVRVYLMTGMFTREQKETLLQAMKDWTNAVQRIGTGVRFTYAGETNDVATCRNCLTLSRREIFKTDRKHYAFFNPLEQDENGQLISAWIDFDYATTDPKALQGFMSHELGHGMGLWDCPSCKSRQTIMTSFPGINKNNGLIEPSPCDLEVVRRVYERRVGGNESLMSRRD